MVKEISREVRHSGQKRLVTLVSLTSTSQTEAYVTACPIFHLS